MIIINYMRAILMALFLLAPALLYAQTPVGANMSNPVIVGIISAGSTYSDTKNNSPTNGYLNDINQPSDDIYYQFTLTSAAMVSLSHCGSNFDTYMLLLDVTGTIIASNDDNGPLCTGSRASIQTQLQAGTYYVVSEGFNYYSGDITTSISIPGSPSGDTPDSFSSRVKSIFQYVDSSPVTTGILLDCGVDFSNLDNFSGATGLVDSNYVTPYTWRMLYASLQSSQFNGQASFTPLSTVNQTIKGYIGGSQPIPLMLLSYNYQALRPDAISANLMYASNDQLFDTPGRTQSPYLTKTVIGISPAVSTYTANNGYVSYLLPSNLMFSNNTVSQILMDAGDGSGYQQVQPGQPLSVHYTSSGTKTLTYQITVNGASLYAHSYVDINYQAEGGTPGGGDAMSWYHPSSTVGTVQVSTPLGIKRAFIHVQLSNSHSDDIIQHPLIVAEGIDYWRITAPNDSANANFGINDFINTIYKGVKDPNAPSATLYDELDAKNYDIVFVDFEDATTNLEYNAALVEQAIQWVNARKQGGNQNVVLGTSMGAVLAKYALRDMELHSINHDTRLFISMDGPHMGANVPLGLQALVQHLSEAKFSLFWGLLPLINFSDMAPGVDIAAQELATPASKQLLIYRVTGDGTMSINNSIHDAFYTSYVNMGMPANCRNVAISNGSECGFGQPYGSGAGLFSLVSSNPPFKAPQILFNLIDLVTFSIQSAAGLLTNRPLIGFGSILGVFSTKTSVSEDFEINALPDHSTQQVYKGQVAIKRKILGLFTVNSSLTNQSVSATSNMLPLDNAPGGQMTTDGGGAISLPASFGNMLLQKSMCFIPEASALFVGGGAISSLSTAQLNSGYSISNPPSGASAIPFARFVTGVKTNLTSNEGHVTFTARNGDFILKELDQNYTALNNCNAVCSNGTATINGPATLCQTATYQVNNSLFSGATTTWSVTGSATLVSSNGNSATIAANGSGTATIQATVASDCSIETLPALTVSVGLQSLSGSDYVDRTYQSSHYQYVTSTVTALPGTSSSDYIWYNEINNQRGSQIGSGLTLNHYPLAPGTVLFFRCEANTTCGTSLYRSYAYNSNGSSSMAASIQIYPNPSSNTMSITATDITPSNSTAQATDAPLQSNQVEYEVQLLNTKGQVLKKGKGKGKDSAILNIQDVPNGTYFIHVISGDILIRKQAVIQH
jgi:hypothetical protein